jgi:hypothetical protein
VLFSRSYDPLFKRKPGEPVTPGERDRWLHGIIKERWFDNDRTYREMKAQLGQVDFVVGKRSSF